MPTNVKKDLAIPKLIYYIYKNYDQMAKRVNPETSLTVFGDEVVIAGDRVWDYDVDGTRIEGTVQPLAARSKAGEPIWEINWDLDPDDFNYLVLNPLQLHKING